MNRATPDATPAQPRSGKRRARGGRRRARWTEFFASALIRVGGLGTIASVTLILVFLVWVVAPLFLGAKAQVHPVAELVSVPAETLAIGVDDRKQVAWMIDARGRLGLWQLSDGAQIDVRAIAGDGQVEGPAQHPTAFALTPDGTRFAAGFEDGSVRVGRITFESEFVTREQRPDVWAALGSQTNTHIGATLAELVADGRARLTNLVLESALVELGANAAARIVALDRSCGSTRDALLVLDARGRLQMVELTRRENLATGAVEWTPSRHDLPFDADPAGALPTRVLLNDSADAGYLAWSDGRLLRYDLRDPEHAHLAQNVDLVAGQGTLTALAFLVGKTTLVAGDSNGAVCAWFPTKPEGASTRDGTVLVRAHELAARGAAIRALAVSGRGRVVAAIDASGTTRLWNVTNDRLLASWTGVEDESSAHIAFAPREDGLVTLTARGVELRDLDLRHPEAGLAALFRPVWYEGYEAPEHVWQSSSGSDAFEPKLGLVPLIFGTLKATFYSMIFAVPVALLAALYTSQFLNARVRAPLKSAIEMMASLPSVVLGFLAGVVVAPFAQQIVPAILVGLVSVPFALFAGAHVLQLLSDRVAARVDGTRRLFATAVTIAIGVVLAIALAAPVERALFAGDLGAWLDGRVGTALGGWIVLLLPLSVALAMLVVSRAIEPALRQRTASWSRSRQARWQALVFVLGSAVALGVAALSGSALQGLGFDPRGGVFDTYVQRNSLIVGAMMGFAVIPIVFTIADDALSAVPAHLKLASIGAGATPWQTAVRVVLPTAASGIFSAIMVGLGRAVGETMIVLMAAGNTPIMSWNVFNGFRTLSANVATEMPESVRGSTHYRTLFLAALCLFAITFVFNTVAEVVRQRYRRRAARL